MGTRLCKEWENNFPTQLQYTVTYPSCIQWISVALENSVERVSCPDNKQYTLLILSGHETSFTEFSNATEIHCNEFTHS